MDRRLLFALPLMLIALVYCGGEPTQTPDADAELAARIEQVENGLLPAVVSKNGEPETHSIADRMAFYKVPGLSVAVIKDFKIEWAKGYGVLEAGGEAAVDTDTLFQAASISKPVAATAAMTMVDEGLIDLDADVNTMLTSWTLPDNEFTAEEQVTLRRIFSHSAGLTVHGFPGYAADAEWPTLQQVLDGEAPANTAAIRVDILPGSINRYSGGGYTVAQQLLMDVAGKPFPQIMKERVLEPAGMTRSTYEQPLPDELADNAARAHHGNGTMISGRWHSYPEMAAAGLWTTPSDLARWAIELMKAEKGESEKVISQQRAKEMLTKQVGGHGVGPGLGGEEEWVRFNHGGSNEGFRCGLYAYYKKGMGVVIMTNGDGGETLMGEFLRAISAEYGWPDFKPKAVEVVEVPVETLQRYIGDYILGGAYRISIELKDGVLYAVGETGNPETLLPLSDTTYIMAEEGFEIEFNLADDGVVTGFIATIGSQKLPGTRVE